MGRRVIVGLLCASLAPAAFSQGTIGSTAFNPAISLILDGKYASYSGTAPQLTGTMTGSEADYFEAPANVAAMSRTARPRLRSRRRGFRRWRCPRA